jgi:hypothetical protein
MNRFQALASAFAIALVALAISLYLRGRFALESQDGASVPAPTLEREKTDGTALPPETDGGIVAASDPQDQAPSPAVPDRFPQFVDAQVVTPSSAEANLALGGVVVDSTTKQPIPGAEILIAPGIWIPRKEIDATEWRTTTTSDKGEFSFDRLTRTSHWITISASGYVRMPIPELVPGESDPPLRVELDRGASITGRVVDEAGHPAVAAVVRVHTLTLSSLDEWRIVQPASTTDRDGRYRIDGLPPSASIRLIANYTEHALAWTEHVETMASTVYEVDIRLSTGLALRGRVEDEAGEPVSGAIVTAHVVPCSDDISLSQLLSPLESAETRTDELGHFEIRHRAGMCYDISAIASGYNPGGIRPSNRDIHRPMTIVLSR